MKRKVISQGHNALTITIPSKWAKRYNISPKDFLNLEEQGNAIVISTEKSAESISKAEFDITGMGAKAIYRVIRAMYKKGVDELLLRYENKETIDSNFKDKVLVFDAIQKKLSQLINFEAIDQGENYCKIHDVATSSSKEFYPLVRRIFLILGECGKDMEKAIQTNDQHLLKSVMHKHDIVGKFVIFCIRILNKEGYKTGIEGVFRYNPDHVIFYFYDLHALHEIADFYNEMATFFLHTKLKVNKETASLFKQFLALMDTFYSLFYKYDTKKVDQLTKQRFDLEGKFRNMAKKSVPPVDLLFGGRIVEACHRFAFMLEAETAIRSNGDLKHEK